MQGASKSPTVTLASKLKEAMDSIFCDLESELEALPKLAFGFKPFSELAPLCEETKAIIRMEETLKSIPLDPKLSPIKKPWGRFLSFWSGYVKEHKSLLEDAFPFFGQARELQVLQAYMESDAPMGWVRAILWARDKLAKTSRRLAWVRSIPSSSSHRIHSLDYTKFSSWQEHEAFVRDMESKRHALCEDLRHQLRQKQMWTSLIEGYAKGERSPEVNELNYHQFGYT
jgi:hypothetical protein